MSARVDDLLRDLRAELEAAAPAPGFRLRVRTFALQSARRRTRRAPAALAAAATIVLAGRLLLPVSSVDPAVPAPPVAPPHAARVDATPVPPAIASSPSRPASRHGTPRAAQAVAQRATTFDVIVSPDEAIALQQYLGRLRAPRQPATVTAQALPPVPLVEIPPIQIEPLSARPSAGNERNPR